MKVRFTRAARGEARRARVAFVDRDPQTAETFERSIEEAVSRLAAYPDAGVEYLHQTRRLPLGTVPSFLVYRVNAREVRVIAVAHTSRRPGYWRERNS